jgi:hypothetical protein
MTTHKRRQSLPEQKMAILRRHPLERMPLSYLCNSNSRFRATYAWNGRQPDVD